MKSLKTILLIGCAVSFLAACGSIKQDLGLGRSAPDEFAVVDRQPLSMPPDFGLRPPTPGAPRPQEIDVTGRAQETLLGAETADKPKQQTADLGLSDSEKALMEQTGANKAPADIRATINRESSEKVVASEHLLQRLLFWKKDAPPGTTVDAPAEAERIKDAKDKGEALNSGATPIIERQKSSWLGL